MEIYDKEGTMTTTKAFTIDDARRIGTAIGIDWETSPFGAGHDRRTELVTANYAQVP